MNPYEERQEARRQRYAALAAKNSQTSDRLWSQGSRMLDAIPFGQPILVGHHSERADRAYRGRACNALDKSCAVRKTADYYATKAESVGTAGISSDDPDALAKLKTKLAQLETKRETIKAGPRQPSWVLSNLGANIRSVKRRIETMARLSAQPVQPDISGDSWKLTENREVNRLQFVFDGKPSDEIRAVLKSHGFRWSNLNKAWQAFLNGHARHQARRVIETVLQSQTL